MASFDKFFPFVQHSEKGYQNKLSDNGNKNSKGVYVGTNHGISARVYEQYLGRVPTERDMRGMSTATAREIIHQVYWNQMLHGDDIHSQQIANAIGDMTVTSEKAALELATQRLLLSGYPVAAHNHYAELGPDAIGAFNHMDANQETIYLNSFSQDRRHFYDGLDASHDASKHGWDNRVVNNFPERPVEGWPETKEENHYLNTKAVQSVLDQKADGHFGEHTQAAVQDYQRAHDFPATGYLDEHTRASLWQDIMTDETARSFGDYDKQRSYELDYRFLSEAPEIQVHENQEWASHDQVLETHDSLQVADNSWATNDHVVDYTDAGPAVEHYSGDNVSDHQSSVGIADSSY